MQQSKRNCPLLAADAVVIRNQKDILLITRGKEPQKGTFAVPGGHVDNGESPEKAVLRELEEECHLKGSNPKLIEVRGEPNRDPRYHVVSIVYRVDVNQEDKPQHDDDAGSAEFYSIQEVKKWGKEKFFADHFELLQNALKDF